MRPVSRAKVEYQESPLRLNARLSVVSATSFTSPSPRFCQAPTCSSPFPSTEEVPKRRLPFLKRPFFHRLFTVSNFSSNVRATRPFDPPKRTKRLHLKVRDSWPGPTFLASESVQRRPTSSSQWILRNILALFLLATD